MNRRILRIAIPSIISNITVPLLGLVDVTIVGHMGDAAYIGAIAVGGMLFNILYWNFGFLRMGTSGLTSQAYGRKDRAEEMRVLCAGFGVWGVVFFAVYSVVAISGGAVGFYSSGSQCGRGSLCHTLFPGLYLGGTCRIDALWI